MKRAWFFAFGILLSPQVFAAEQAPQFLKHMAGCFEVNYHYVEVGEKVYPAYRESGPEWITLKSDGETHTLQHYGIFGGHAITHWGQTWRKVRDGNWHQAVLSPTGKIRYECDGELKESETTAQRQCEAEGAPKPRRDSKRADYETLDRVHVYNITKDGWQDVQKNVKRTKADEPVADEIGWNEYRRVDESACQAAIQKFGR